MTKVDLITGFLGAGKTTLIKKYAEYLIRKEQEIGIVENDYGSINIDMMLLQDLPQEHCELEMVAGGCDYETHMRRFRTKLIALGMYGLNRVIVEPSGIYDVDEFFDVLGEEPLDRWYGKGSVVALVDAGLEEELSEQSEYLLASQIAKAGLIILSRGDQADEAQVNRTVAHMNRVMERFGCNRRFGAEEIMVRNLNEMTDEDFKQIENCGYEIADHMKLQVQKENEYASLFYMNQSYDPEELRERIGQLMKDATCGQVFRVKGFLRTEKGWLEVNATAEQIRMEPIGQGQEVLIVIGENLDEGRVDHYMNK